MLTMILMLCPNTRVYYISDVEVACFLNMLQGKLKTNFTLIINNSEITGVNAVVASNKVLHLSGVFEVLYFT